MGAGSLGRSRTRRTSLAVLASLAVAGTFVVAGPATAGPSAPRARVSPAVAPSCTNTTVIGFGASPTSGSITDPGQVDCYEFEGKVQHHVRIDVVATSGTLEAQTQVVDENGNTVCGPSTDTEQTCVFTAKAIYTIVIDDSTGTNTGDYNVYAQDLSNPVACNFIGFGDPPLVSTISAAAGADCYALKAQVGSASAGTRRRHRRHARAQRRSDQQAAA